MKKHSQHQKLWTAIRIFRRFQYADLVRTTGIRIRTCRWFVTGLVDLGVVREDGKSGMKKIFRLVKDSTTLPSGLYSRESIKRRAVKYENSISTPELDLEIKTLYAQRIKKGDRASLAKKYGVSISTIRNRAIKLGINITPQEWGENEIRICNDNIDKKPSEIRMILTAAGFERSQKSVESKVYKIRRNQ